jgi:hypothetical protein
VISYGAAPVCLIAEEHLSHKAKRMIHKLRGDSIDISDSEIANRNDAVHPQRTETGPWHHVNIPTDAPAFEPATKRARSR